MIPFHRNLSYTQLPYLYSVSFEETKIDITHTMSGDTAGLMSHPERADHKLTAAPEQVPLQAWKSQ